MALDRSHFRYPPPVLTDLREIASFLRPIPLSHPIARASIVSRRTRYGSRKTSSCEFHPTAACACGLNLSVRGSRASRHRPKSLGAKARARSDVTSLHDVRQHTVRRAEQRQRP